MKYIHDRLSLAEYRRRLEKDPGMLKAWLLTEIFAPELIRINSPLQPKSLFQEQRSSTNTGIHVVVHHF